MEKIKTFTFFMAMLTSICATGQTLTFRFDAPRIIYVEPINFLELDVMVSASSDEYLHSGTVALNFNSTNLTLVDAVAGDVLAGNNTNDPVAPKYNVTPSFEGSIVSIVIEGNQTAFEKDPIIPADWNLITETPAILATVRFQINGYENGQEAGISFVEATMNGQWEYIIGTSATGNYINPNVYSNNLSDVYLGRIYADNVDLGIPSLLGWSQAGGFNNTDALYTSIWSGTGTGFLTVPGQAVNMRIHPGATLSIPVANAGVQTGGQWNVETVELNGSLIIQSSALGTGSLIADEIIGLGTATFNRYMAGNAWQLVASPAEQLVEDFLFNNPNVPEKEIDLVDRRGMIGYNSLLDEWVYFESNTDYGLTAPGRGFGLRTDNPEVVSFEGSLVAGNGFVPITDDGEGWNLIGNPYTSAISINVDLNPVNSFLSANLLNLDPLYPSLYIWDESVSTTQYQVVSLASDDEFAAVGQGFFVKAAPDATTVEFNTNMQTHLPFEQLKSASVKPGVKLVASTNGKYISTDVKFFNHATPGLDPGYDAGALKLDKNFALYTRLVEDIGVDFAIQSLPRNGLENYVVPVGIDFKDGGQLAFTAQLLSLPSSINVVLEDRLNNVFTPLNSDDSRYTTTLAANTGSTGRFFLHVSYSTTGIEDELNTNPLNAYMMRNEIVIDGNVSSNAVATLYDLQGRSVLSRNLEQGLRNRIMPQGLKTGVYLLHIVDNGQRVSFKLPVVK